MPQRKSDELKGPKEYAVYYRSPIGTIEIRGTRAGLTSLVFTKAKTATASPVPVSLQRALQQVDEYFRGQRKKFSLNLVLDGTDFQKKVWRELLKIPYGGTASYKDTAEAIGKKRAFRAVGNANRLNKISIIIPCHRVIGTGGGLTGYGGGVWRKKWLLEHEQSEKSRGC